MSQSLSRAQAVLLGLVVLAAALAGVAGLTQIGQRQGLFGSAFELSVGFPEVNDLRPGTPVRLRGLDVGQVVALDYPEADSPGAVVTLRLRLDARFRERVYADASAQVQSTGLLSGKVVAILPGTPESGPLTTGQLRAAAAPDFAAITAKVDRTADEVEALVREVRQSNGTAMRLVRDDDLYREFKGLVQDSRERVRGFDAFVADGRDTLRSIRKSSDALSGLPLIRGYVPEDAQKLIDRPQLRKEAMTYAAADLFEPDMAILTDAGRAHLGAVVEWLRGVRGNDKADVMVLASAAPGGRSPEELTARRAEAVLKFLDERKTFSLGWFTTRKSHAFGLGTAPVPVQSPPAPADCVQVILYSSP